MMSRRAVGESDGTRPLTPANSTPSPAFTLAARGAALANVAGAWRVNRRGVRNQLI